ncbi:MAG: hypothetical protein ABWZ26_04270 [Candidatus Nanopelagicales bacterium]
MRPDPPSRPPRHDLDIPTDVTRDEVDHWGELPVEAAAEDDRYLWERPPHHGD